MVNPYDVNAYNDALILTNYNYGVPMDSYTFSDCLYGAGAFAGISTVWNSGAWLLKNRHDYGTGWQNVKNQYASARSLMTKNPFYNAWNYNRVKTLLDFEKRCYPAISADTQGLNLTAKQRLRHMRQSRISRQYSDARALINTTKEEFRQGKLKGKRFKVRQRQINQALQEADSKAAVLKKSAKKGKIPATGSANAVTNSATNAAANSSANAVTNSATNAAANSSANAAANSATNAANSTVGTVTKGTTLGAVKNAVTKTTKKGITGKLLKMAGKAGKCIKGNIFAAGIGLALEAPAIINAYKTGSKDKNAKSLGHKQLAHSVGKTVVGLAGYVGGAAALGAAVGSVVPVAGTAIGTVVGIIGGCIGYFLADKAYSKLVPSPLEQYSKKQAEEAVKNPEKMKEVLKNTEEKAATETDETVLAELQQSYDNLSVQTDDTLPEQVEEENPTVKQELTDEEAVADTPVQTEKKTRNRSKLAETLDWFRQMLSSIYQPYQYYNINNNSNYYQYNNSPYNTFYPYKTPFYQMPPQYGYIA